MPYTQENRLIAVDTPLGADVLLLQGLTGNEGVSRLFRFDLDVLSEKNSISFKDVVGQNVTIRITLGDNTPRYFNGFVSRFAQSGSDVRFTHYQMEVVPWLWFLTRIADCRIFQEKTIPDIIKAVFDSRGFQDYKFSLTSTYDPREYCVQYRETDFNFVSRLMEQYGIFYFFEHENGKHTLVLGDSESVHQPCPHQSKAGYNLVVGGLDADELAKTAAIAKYHDAGNFRKQRVILAAADVFAGLKDGAALPHQNRPARHRFSAESFYAQTLGIRIAPVLGTA